VQIKVLPAPTSSGNGPGGHAREPVPEDLRPAARDVRHPRGSAVAAGASGTGAGLIGSEICSSHRPRRRAGAQDRHQREQPHLLTSGCGGMPTACDPAVTSATTRVGRRTSSAAGRFMPPRTNTSVMKRLREAVKGNIGGTSHVLRGRTRGRRVRGVHFVGQGGPTSVMGRPSVSELMTRVASRSTLRGAPCGSARARLRRLRRPAVPQQIEAAARSRSPTWRCDGTS
jgi:hypothetical protein